MGLLDDILSWTVNELTAWQRDAARRLFQQPCGLTEADYDELYQLLKASHNLPADEKLQPVPLGKEHLPTNVGGSKPVVLKTIRDMKDVNRIATDAVLTFADQGVTVVYGGNGSGKSGYSRVLKQACRARDQSERVLPDATDPASHAHIPEATFDLEVQAAPIAVTWKANQTPPVELGTVAVFDSHCARAYLTEGEVAYLPYGLDVVEDLAHKVIPQLSARLEKEIAAISVDGTPFNHLAGETVVGRAVQSIGPTTDSTALLALATLSQQEASRLGELDQALRAPDPKAKARELRLSAQRIKELVQRIDNALKWVSSDAVGKLKRLDDAVVTAERAERLAASELRAGEELLAGTGDAVWKQLFEAAREFSTEVAYAGQAFPNAAPSAVCPLCQQPLADAAGRLQRFQRYVEADAARTAVDARQQIAAARAKIQRAELMISLDNALREELAPLDVACVAAAEGLATAIDTRRTAMLAAAESHQWGAIPALDLSSRQRLRKVVAQLLRAERIYVGASDEARIARLRSEFSELNARKQLGACLAPLISVVEKMRTKAALEKCRNDLNTRAISSKSKELAGKAVTEGLRNALESEFRSLGICHVKTKLAERSEKGKTKHRLVLDLPTTALLQQVLSEGEQRAISLASFLAELRLANHRGAIVFDDPVSSLDHWRRRDVARRLVEEAKIRQVIILTHDTTFLAQLQEQIEATGVQHAIRHLAWCDNRPGNVFDGLPWEHASYKERIDCLEKQQKRLEKLPWPPYPNASEANDMIRQYDLLRATIERVVQDVILGGTVQRYKDYIEVKKLAAVIGFQQAEFDEIMRLYRTCHGIVTTHDPASAKNAAPPTPVALKGDIDALKALIAAISTRRSQKKSAVAVSV